MQGPDIENPAVVKDMTTYHPPQGDQPAKYARINEAAEKLISVIAEACPPSADRSAAVRAVREARMWANSSIANNGKY